MGTSSWRKNAYEFMKAVGDKEEIMRRGVVGREERDTKSVSLVCVCVCV